jgi:hypothetical protein
MVSVKFLKKFVEIAFFGHGSVPERHWMRRGSRRAGK